jgi:hypothetical protein
MGWQSPPDDLMISECYLMPECMSIEKLIHRYATNYGLDPAVVEKKDIIELYVYQMCINEESWITYHRMQK